jgi:hypothetical protein
MKTATSSTAYGGWVRASINIEKKTSDLNFKTFVKNSSNG